MTDVPQAPSPWRRWLWPAVLTGWAALLLVLAVVSYHTDPPSIRDQTSLSDARGTIDGTVGRISGALPSGFQINDEGYDQHTCDLSLARDGAETTRRLTVSGPDGQESSALEQIAQSLRGARIRPADGPVQSFYFDAGDYVAVRGRVTGTGTVMIELASGCRIPK